MSTIINGSSPSITFSDGSAQTSATRPFQNRIINGAMTIDQRNAGASVSLTSGGGVGYPADRWYVENFTDGTATVQQVADAPTGFSNSIKYTVTATDSSLASDQSAFMQQRIEGFNTSDLMFGTANAQTVTVSFWVKSSVTGTFGVALANSAYDRGYPVAFTVNAANTWEQKTATITGDTSGTWIGATNGVGIRVSFGLAAGSARVATSGAWSASTVLGVSGQVNLMATNGATFQVTGVQLEVGSTATSFDYRPYGTELQLCQRYYYNIFGTAVDFQAFGCGVWLSSTVGKVLIDLPVPLRSVPTLEAASIRLFDAAASTTRSATGFSIAFTVTPTNKAFIDVTVGSSSSAAGDACLAVLNTSTSARIGFSSEL